MRLEVVLRPVNPVLTRSERRSWLLHRRLSRRLDQQTFDDWLPTMRLNLERVKHGTQGQPHERHIDEWQQMLMRRDVNLVKRTLTGLSRHDIEMREVSPVSGLLSESERDEVLGLSRG